jgi:hypothetical protein
MGQGPKDDLQTRQTGLDQPEGCNYQATPTGPEESEALHEYLSHYAEGFAAFLIPSIYDPQLLAITPDPFTLLTARTATEHRRMLPRSSAQ